MKLSWYYEAYGRGAHSRALDEAKDTNPLTYGTPEHDAWNDGWELRK